MISAGPGAESITSFAFLFFFEHDFASIHGNKRLHDLPIAGLSRSFEGSYVIAIEH